MLSDTHRSTWACAESKVWKTALPRVRMFEELFLTGGKLHILSRKVVPLSTFVFEIFYESIYKKCKYYLREQNE